MMSICDLPLDIIINITEYLKLSDLFHLMLTCKTFSIILKENAIWSCRGDLTINSSGDSSNSISPSWYERCRISHNWCNGFYQNKIIQHQSNFMPWINFFNSKALFLSVGSELLCYKTSKHGIPDFKSAQWKLEVPKVKRNDIRTNDISRFSIKDHIIVCGNRDGCAAVYTFHSLKQKPRLLHHITDCHEAGLVEVSAVEIINNKTTFHVITASSKSATLSSWCWQSKENVENENYCLKNNMVQIPLHGYQGVRCLALHKAQDKLAIGLNGNCKPILLDVMTRSLLLNAHETQDINQATRDIQWHNNNLVAFVTHSGLLQMVDIRTNQVVYNAMDPFLSTLYCLKTDGDRAVVVGSSMHSRCVLFDMRRSSRHVQLYFTQMRRSPIYSLDFDSSRLFAEADRTLAALDFKVNASRTMQRDYSHAFEFVKR